VKIPDLAVFTATPAVASVNRMSTYRLTGSAESGWAPVTYVAVSIDEASGPDIGGNVQPLAQPATTRVWPTTRPNATRSSSVDTQTSDDEGRCSGSYLK
jgi:hypothetical protein